jgi:hypothetical protein
VHAKVGDGVAQELVDDVAAVGAGAALLLAHEGRDDGALGRFGDCDCWFRLLLGLMRGGGNVPTPTRPPTVASFFTFGFLVFVITAFVSTVPLVAIFTSGLNTSN